MNNASCRIVEYFVFVPCGGVVGSGPNVGDEFVGADLPATMRKKSAVCAMRGRKRFKHLGKEYAIIVVGPHVRRDGLVPIVGVRHEFIYRKAILASRNLLSENS